MKYCQNCGNKMEDSDNFCLSCGAKSIIPDVSPQYPNMQYPNIPYPYPRKRVNPLAIILPVAAVFIIGAVLLIVLLTGGNTPSGVVQRYLDASKTRRHERGSGMHGA